MDQYLRSLGDIKTYYGSKLAFALSTFEEKRPGLVFCEMNFSDSSAQYFIHKIGGLDATADMYFVLAVEEAAAELEPLRRELGIDALLVKPFNAEKIGLITKAAQEKAARKKLAWEIELRVAKQADKDKRYVEAEAVFSKIGKAYLDNAVVQRDWAEYLLQKGKLDKAEGILHKILSAAPDDMRAMWLMGILQRRRGNYALALRYLKDAQDASPLNQIRAMDIAEAHAYLAGHEARHANILDENYSEAHLLHGKALCTTRQYPHAVTYLETHMNQLSAKDRKEAEAYIALAKRLGQIA